MKLTLGKIIKITFQGKQKSGSRLWRTSFTIETMSVSLDSHIEKVLWTQDQILDRVAQIASQITLDFKASPDPPLFVGVATGAFLFLADLVKRVQLPLSVDLVRAQSYGSGTLSNGAPSISLDLKLDVKGKHVILVIPHYPFSYVYFFFTLIVATFFYAFEINVM